jgi:hypothetical protein
MSGKSSKREDKINYIDRKGKKTRCLRTEGGGGGEFHRVACIDNVIFNFEATATSASTWCRTNTIEDNERYNKIFL